MSDLNIGLKLANRYELLEPLGTGVYGASLSGRRYAAG